MYYVVIMLHCKFHIYLDDLCGQPAHPMDFKITLHSLLWGTTYVDDQFSPHGLQAYITPSMSCPFVKCQGAYMMCNMHAICNVKQVDVYKYEPHVSDKVSPQ